MDYQETLDWIFSKLPVYQQKGIKAFNGKLEPITRFVSYLGMPHKKFSSIHIGGTNGKGSSSHMIASILQEARYKVGLYTSPHLRDFRERIKINGVSISPQEVVDFVAQYRDYIQRETLSFFELTVGMAFHHFAIKKVDFAVIEVGLGGRLDSTNIITPEICLITNIGLDHTAILGDSLVKIAREKAGIIKKKISVIIGEYQQETWRVFLEKAQNQKSEIILAKNYNYQTDLKGIYQSKNINGVVELIRQLPNTTIAEKEIAKGLLNVISNTGIQGRWQQLRQSPNVICDIAHNKEGLQYTMKQLAKETYQKLHIVLGMVEDKPWKDILSILPKRACYYFCKPNILRGLEVNSLCLKAQYFGLKGEGYSSVFEAYSEALKKATAQDLIYVGGSTFVVAEVL